MNYETESGTMLQMAPVVNDPGELMNLDYDNVLALANRADKMVEAMNKIMSAAIRITTEKDWVLIGGTPYLQESGATKVARLFGIGWEILGIQKETDELGYPAFTYRMAFTMGAARIECEGSRSAKDEFFAGGKTDRSGNPKKQKSPDEIDLRNVKLAAYTNCLNNGIKRILPGLRNLDVEALERGGLDGKKLRGYTFKDGSRGGRGTSAAASGLVCSACGAAITQAEASYSQAKMGALLCRKCQKNPPAAAELDGPSYDDADAPPERR